MRKERIADTLLALVTTRERAASTAGDLKEQAGVRGDFWFWSSVLRTMGALMWRSFAETPFRLLWLGFCGSLVAMGVAFVAGGLAFVATSAIFAVGHLSVVAGPGVAPNLTMPRSVLWTYYVLFSGLFVLSMFPVGRWVAQRASEREITAAVSLIFMQFLVMGLLEMSFPSVDWNPPGEMLPLLTAVNLFALLANLAGAIQVRRRLAP